MLSTTSLERARFEIPRCGRGAPYFHHVVDGSQLELRMMVRSFGEKSLVSLGWVRVRVGWGYSLALTLALTLIQAALTPCRPP